MIDIDKWQEIFATIKQHKLRTALSAFGVFWGIFMLVVLLGVGKSFERGTLDDFGGRANSMFIWIGGPTTMPYQGLSPGRWVSIKPEDLDAIRQTLPELGLLSGVNRYGGGRSRQFITRNGRSGAFDTRGVEPSMIKISGFRMPQGRFINDLDFEERRKIAVIGETAKNVLFEPHENPIGENLRIGGVNFKIVGVFKSVRDGEDARRDEERVLLPNSSLRHTFNQTGWIGHIEQTAKTGMDSEVLYEKTLQLLKKRHKVHPDDNSVFRSFNMNKIFKESQALFDGLRAFSWVVAIGTIFSGVIGVGNIMLIIVKERTREIGLRKALGANSSHIIGMIVQESLVLTFFAGYLGLVVGVFLLETITDALSSSADMNMGQAEIDFNTAFTALAVLVFAGVIASLLPALKAAKVDPIVALQDE